MTPYARLSPDAGVVEFELGSDLIRVRFKSPTIYKYTVASAGADAIAAMKRHAESGKGLSTYIAQHKPTYESKT
jgi:hypothetical protein